MLIRNVCLFLYKIHVLVFDELLESIFCLLLIVEAFSLQKVVGILEEVVVSWREGLVNMADEARLRSPIRPAFKTFIVRRAVGRCRGEELGSFC